MAKRKREVANGKGLDASEQEVKKAKSNGIKSSAAIEPSPITIQIVAGSYDRILHGITAAIQDNGKVDFADSFLFSAHTSAIRCLAISPPSAPSPKQSQKVVLATGGRDERINLYHLSAHPPSLRQSKDDQLLSALAPRPVLENTKNRELGSLLHHSSTVTRLAFPTRTKLLSSSEDSTIAITRTRDWSLLTTIKVPKPKVAGRPSGDTAPAGGTPTGVNDFAIHPSMKTMISVSKGERSMRLWNLLTGKKAGVLNFDKAMLQEIGELKHSTTGEGQKVAWGSNSEEFAVGFDRDILVFNMDSRVRCRVMPDARTRLHQFRYLKLGDEAELSVLAVSTEDGLISIFSTRPEDLEDPSKDQKLSHASLLARIGGKEDGIFGRIKDFVVLQTPTKPNNWYIAAGCSDGSLRLWEVARANLEAQMQKPSKKATVAKLLGTYATQNRITCLDAFVMIPRPEGAEESEDDLEVSGEESHEDSEVDEIDQ